MIKVYQYKTLFCNSPEIKSNSHVIVADIDLQFKINFAENKWSSFDVIYYEYGSLVLVYNNAERATRAYKLLQGRPFDDKQILVLLLPNIQVFINYNLLYIKIKKNVLIS